MKTNVSLENYQELSLKDYVKAIKKDKKFISSAKGIVVVKDHVFSCKKKGTLLLLTKTSGLAKSTSKELQKNGSKSSKLAGCAVKVSEGTLKLKPLTGGMSAQKINEDAKAIDLMTKAFGMTSAQAVALEPQEKEALDNAVQPPAKGQKTTEMMGAEKELFNFVNKVADSISILESLHKKTSKIIADFNINSDLSDASKAFSQIELDKEITGLKDKLRYYLKVKQKVINMIKDHQDGIKGITTESMMHQKTFEGRHINKKVDYCNETQKHAGDNLRYSQRMRTELLQGLNPIIQQIQNNLRTLNQLEVR